jgi:AcrR family transcriptional regulator
LDQGYAGTTTAGIARTVGVSVETIYKGFGAALEVAALLNRVLSTRR